MGFHSLEVKFFLCQGNNDIKLLDEFRADFIIWFSWQPKPGQNWSADKVNFTNAIGDEAIKVAIWTKPDPQLPRQRFQAMIYEGEFKAFNRYEAYPADKLFAGNQARLPKSFLW